MKKIFIFVCCICLGLCSCKKNNEGINNSRRFAKYFDKKCSNYEFLIKNPMLYSLDNNINPTYFEQLWKVKGRIIKSDWEKYYLNTSGQKIGGYYPNQNPKKRNAKYFSDWPIYTGYMKFNLTGQVEYSYSLEKGSLLGLEKLIYKEYIYTEDKYLEDTYIYEQWFNGLKLVEQKRQEYNIIQTDDKLIFETQIKFEESGEEYEYTEQYIFEKGKITNNSIFYGELFEQTITTFNKKKTEVNRYDPTLKNYDVPIEYTIYERGKKINEKKEYPDGFSYINYTFETKNKGNKLTTNRRPIEPYQEHEYFEQKYNWHGFLKYSFERPIIEYSYGYYTTYNAKRLLWQDSELKTILEDLPK